MSSFAWMAIGTSAVLTLVVFVGLFFIEFNHLFTSEPGGCPSLEPFNTSGCADKVVGSEPATQLLQEFKATMLEEGALICETEGVTAQDCARMLREQAERYRASELG